MKPIAEITICLVGLASFAGCTAAPERAGVGPRSGGGTTQAAPLAPVAPPPSAAPSTVAALPSTESTPEVVVPPPVFPEPMVTIGRGELTMGCPKAAEAGCRDDEKPRHRVLLSPYEIDVFEVTAGHYKACMDAGACHYPIVELDDPELRGSNAKAAAFCREQFRPEGSKLPVVCVGMTEAQEYCEWRDKRLPTEAEWERAARGDKSSKDGGARSYPWGDEPPGADRACVQAEARCEVGSHPGGISPFGLHDMAGNAAEWVWDFYDPAFYASSPLRDPDGSWELLPIHRQSCSAPICWTARGGSWRDEPVALRSTARRPEASNEVWAFATIGFRCARSTEESRRDYFANRENLWNAKRIHGRSLPKGGQ